MNGKEANLLLYLETCCVDGDGLAEGRRMNKEDLQIAERWVKEGLIFFGRLKMSELEALPRTGQRVPTHFVRFSSDAWHEAHYLRKQRAIRMISKWEARYAVPEGLVDQSEGRWKP